MIDYESIIGDLKNQYLADSRPWVIGFSGGKDSTCTLQLVYQMLCSLPPEKRTKQVHVLSSDTLVEAPVVGIRQRKICKMVNAAAGKDEIPLTVEMLRPQISDTFWVNVIGRGYPAPNRWFRWCTDRLKIKPMTSYILKNIKENGEVLIILGARKSESASRSQTLAKHEIGNTKMRKHANIRGAFVYTPIEDLEEAEVWEYLDTVPSPWGDDNSSLHAMYQRKDDEEISFIIDDTSPSSGHSRFGCWVCTVVEEDKALKSLIEDGHPEYKPLLEFRNELKIMRNDPECREKFLKNQRIDRFISEYLGADSPVKQTHRGFEVMGPFKLEIRHELLLKLLNIQKTLQQTDPEIQLISPEELKAIELLWMYDGDAIESMSNISSTPRPDSINYLMARLLKIEEDMSDLSKRVGVYKKLEQVIMEYSMNSLVSDNGENSLTIYPEAGNDEN